jgi:PPOX class probable F420-dependent enzyme
MTGVIPATHADLLSRDKKAFASLALTTSKGEPHVTPMWFDYDGENIVFNTARGRVKDKILKKKPVVALAVADPANPYRYIQIRGPVVFESDEGEFGYPQISRLNEKYHGTPAYPKRPGEVRVTYKVRPERVNTMG